MAALTARWLHHVRDWVATTARRAEAHGAEDPLASALVLRMDEFTSKDLTLRAEVLRTALAHFRVVRARRGREAMELGGNGENWKGGMESIRKERGVRGNRSHAF